MTMCKLFYLSKSPPVCGCFLANSLCNWVYVGMNQRFQNRIWTVRIILTQRPVGGHGDLANLMNSYWAYCNFDEPLCWLEERGWENFHFPPILLGKQHPSTHREREREREVTLSEVYLEDHGRGLVDGAEDKAPQQPKTKQVWIWRNRILFFIN